MTHLREVLEVLFMAVAILFMVVLACVCISGMAFLLQGMKAGGL